MAFTEEKRDLRCKCGRNLLLRYRAAIWVYDCETYPRCEYARAADQATGAPKKECKHPGRAYRRITGNHLERLTKTPKDFGKSKSSVSALLELLLGNDDL